jgi:hypothetical protein
MKSLLKKTIRRVGYEVINLRTPTNSGIFPKDFSPSDIQVYARVRPYTQTTPERVFALRRAVEYVLGCAIPGSFVECGVWKGGSVMAIALTLLASQCSDRDLYLFDTFQGMSPPSPSDGDWVRREWGRRQRAPGRNDWNFAPIDEVKANIASTGYPASRIHYVAGRVEDTLPESAPETIALLRLDTDFYESTKHELRTLYPRLQRGGVMIIDDYGAFEGARKATDEFLEETKVGLLLNRIDSDARIGIKL